MKNIKILEYKKNSKFEIEFTNLNEIEGGDKVVLFLKDGDISPLYVYVNDLCRYKIHEGDIQIYLPFCPKTSLLQTIYYNISNTGFHIFCFDSENLDDSDVNFKNILPKWNILEDNAVLFLSDEDYSRYIEWIDFSKHAPELNNLFINLYPNVDGILDDMIGCKKVSLIIPELHAEDKSCQYHIDNINKVCKELKEKYRVERIELFVSHCFLPKLWHNGVMENKFAFNKQSFTYSDSAIFYHNIYIGYRVLNDNLFKHIDKITTTNSTGILEVQKSDRLEVVDVITFFKDNLLNIKQSI